MIGELPKTLEVDGKEYEIRTDFRVALLIFQALNNPDLSDKEKALIYLKSLYKEVPPNLDEAFKKAGWFLDGGNIPKSKKAPKQLMDWEQDESIMFPALNKVAGYETRSAEYLHWWSFLGLFNEVGEGLWSQVINIRSKKAKHKKLEKWEEEFYKDHREIIDLKKKYTSDELSEMERINKMLS
jgi:hypothetical protein